MNTARHWIAGLAVASIAAAAQAAVTADEAKALGTTLTPVGAEKAANKDGTIPAYDGGLTAAPAGFKPGSGMRPNPFAGEKARFWIPQDMAYKGQQPPYGMLVFDIELIEFK